MAEKKTYLIELPRGTRWPNMHEWVFAVFALITFRILDMIATNMALLENASFMQLTQTLVGGGVIACAAWLWTSNKSREAEEKIREEKRPAQPAPPTIQPTPSSEGREM